MIDQYSEKSKPHNGYKKIFSDDSNPFVYQIELTKLQKLQIFIMSFTVLPVRIVLAIPVFFIAWLLAAIFTVGSSHDAPQPAGPIRHRLYQFLRLMGRLIIFILGFSITIKGQRVTAHEAPILVVAPHTSLWDILVLFVTSPFPSVLSKYDNFKIPIFGTLMRATQPILLKRKESPSIQQTVNAILKRVKANEEWPQLIVFPEGTCTNKKSLIRFNIGAFLAGTPVQPVIMRYKNSMDTFTWTEKSESALRLIWWTLCQVRSNLEVEYLSPYQPTLDEAQDSKLYANNVQRYFAEKLQLPCSNHTYDDRLLLKQAKKLKFPINEALLEFHTMRTKCNLNLNDAFKRLEEFAKMVCFREDGLANIQDFANYLGLNITDAVETLFQIFDPAQTGVIRFRDYVIGYSTLTSTTSNATQLEAVCSLFALKNFDCISDRFNSNKSLQTNRIELQMEIHSLLQQTCMVTNKHSSDLTAENLIDFAKENSLFSFLFVWYYDRITNLDNSIDSKQWAKSKESKLLKRLQNK